MNVADRKTNASPYTRQIAFFCAFLLPMGKLMEAPSLLAKYAKGDLLFPALIQFVLQALVLFCVVLALSSSKATLHERLVAVFGKGTSVVYAVFVFYYLLSAVLPLLDLEKFVYAVYFDTAPTTFSFGFFFLVSAFIATKGIKAVGRFADASLFLFLLPFVALLFMSLFEADFSTLLPIVGTSPKESLRAVLKTTPHFSDVALLLPLFLHFRYEKGDGVKIMTGYGVGAGLCLLFFAVFYGIFSTIAPREHYAFSKIAQYFPALSVVGRIDLVFVYLLSVALIFFTALPIVYAGELSANLFRTEKKTLISLILNLLAFVFVLFCNRLYDSFYAVFTGPLVPVFTFISYLLPCFCLFLPKMTDKENALA